MKQTKLSTVTASFENFWILHIFTWQTKFSQRWFNVTTDVNNIPQLIN